MLNRRNFIAAGGAALAFAGLQRACAEPMPADAGTLVPDPEGLFDLPPRFSYRVVSREGATMADGLLVPGRFDGMGAFAGAGGRTVLVRNHELWAHDTETAFGPDDRLLSDAVRAKMFGRDERVAQGGTSTVVIGPDGRVEREFLSLAGTLRNCAGGTTPWGSWLTCEEPKVGRTDKLLDGHGWVFEVPSSSRALVDAVPLKALGRFNHEAAAVDRRTGVVYLTEDRKDGLFYRLLPNARGELAKGGRLQAMAVEGTPDSANRDRAWTMGAARRVRWIDMTDVESPGDDLRLQGHAAGGTRFVRGEGLAETADGSIYFTCTEGGAVGKGQVFHYRPSRFEGRGDERRAPGVVTLFAEPDDRSVIDMPDNLCVAPFGGLVVCEDGGEAKDANYLRLLDAKGRIRTIGRNAHPKQAELAGSCFSPDGRTLFVNIYAPGHTLAITGPWETLRA
jgi:secreted PhoX family phosphatase